MLDTMDGHQSPSIWLTLLRITSTGVGILLARIDTVINMPSIEYKDVDQGLVYFAHIMSAIVLIGTFDNTFNDSRIVKYIKRKLKKVKP